VPVDVLPDAEAVGAAAARHWLDCLARRPGLVVAVPAGRTPRPMYRHLRVEAAGRRLSFAACHVFGVDELCLPGAREGYFWRQIREAFLDRAGIPPSHRHPFDPAATDLQAMCDGLEARIRELGGLDLAILGLGPNGHLAANEPGSPLDSRARPVRLDPATLAHLATDPAAPGPVSDRAVTLGLGTLAEARQVLVLVTGAGKREILRRALAGPVGPECPASLLQRLPAARVLADRAAAGSD